MLDWAIIAGVGVVVVAWWVVDGFFRTRKYKALLGDDGYKIMKGKK